MNFDKLYAWTLGIVIAFAAAGHLDALQTWLWRAQARVLYESRTEKWGPPNFFSTRLENHHKSDRAKKVKPTSVQSPLQ